LQRTKAIDILAEQKLCAVNANQTIGECLQILNENNITGAPVIEGKRAVAGFVDVLDVAAYALHLWRAYNRTARIQELLEKNKFMDTRVRDVINFSRRNDWITVNEGASLLDCIHNFHSRVYRSHRLAILDNNGELRNLITMSDIIKFAAKHSSVIPFSDNTVTELSLIRACIMVRCDSLLYNTLAVLCDHRISGLALVDWENKLVANFSASDLKGMLLNAFEMFDKPTIEFIRKGTQIKSKIPPVTASQHLSLKEALKMMSDTKIHRIFITDDKQLPFGIVSCTDVVQALAPQTPVPLSSS